MNILETAKAREDFDFRTQYSPDRYSLKFLRLGESTDSKVIGRKYPQVNIIDSKAAYSIGSDKFNDNLKFDKISLYKSSKLTDILICIEISAPALLLSKKALDVFQSCNLGNYRIYPATVELKDKTFEYGVLHFLNNLSVNLDFERSSFYTANSADIYKSDIDITDMEDYSKKNTDMFFSQGNDRFSRINLKEGFLKNKEIPDIFEMDFLPERPIITLKLAEAIVKHGLTGFEFFKVYNLME